MDGNSVNTPDLYNDFSSLGRLDNVSYKINGQGTQFLEIKHPDNFIIEITIPDKMFEWFIDIFDDHRKKLVSDWDDDYDETIDVLKANRQKAVEEFVGSVLTHKLRYVFDKKRFKEISTVQIFRDNSWTELISNSKLKLW